MKKAKLSTIVVATLALATGCIGFHLFTMGAAVPGIIVIVAAGTLLGASRG